LLFDCIVRLGEGKARPLRSVGNSITASSV
jgi:hypothetical protein